jgi:H+/Cl- antiporter ClcA
MDVRSSTARRQRESFFQINPNRQIKSNFIITDLFTNIEEVSKPASEVPQSSVKQFLTSQHILNPTIILALLFLGFSAAVLGFFLELAIQELQLLRFFLLKITENNEIFSLGCWVVSCVVITELGCFLASGLNKDCEGSGVPEVKAILSGVRLPGFLSFKTLFRKAAGVVAAVGGGLSVGKEGPFVHISAVVSHQIAKISIFRHIRNVTEK